MDKKFNSILDELSDYVPHRDREHFIESRAQQVIASFNNLRALIEGSFDADTADELTRRLLLAAKSGDGRKFSRKLHEMRKAKGNNVGERKS